jgi:hypothetical protein
LKACKCILWNKFIFKEKTYSVQNFWNDPSIWSKVVFQKLRATELVKTIIHHLSNPEFHLHVNINPPMKPVLKQFNFVHTLTLYVFKVLFNAYVSQVMTFAPLSD